MRTEKREVTVSFMGEIVPMKVVKPSVPNRYVWATVADTAGLVRNLLKKRFGWKSGKDFVLRTETFANGNSMDLVINPQTWNRLNEHNQAYVEAIKGSVKDGYFDGMSDMYVDKYQNNVRTVEGEEVSLSCKYYRMSCDESNWNYR
jgi:hypothetical protein